MILMRLCLSAAALMALLAACQRLPAAASVSCRLSAQGVSLGTSDGIDYAHLDRANQRIYVAGDGGIDVWNARSGAPVGRIRDISGTTGIVTAPSFNRGFAAEGSTGTISIFNLSTLQVVGRIPYGNPPNGMVFDAATGTVAAVSSAGRDVRLIDAASGTVVGAVQLAGSPRAMWSRGDGMLYLRLDRPARIVRVSLGARRVDARWPWTACKGPHYVAAQ